MFRRPGALRDHRAASGHIAGVVNPADKPKYQFWTDGPPEGDFEFLARRREGDAGFVVGRLDKVDRSSGAGESPGPQMARFSAAGVTSISGTPSHWRRVLMFWERGAFAPSYIRLSGEIADQPMLDALRSAFPGANIGHAYASTEAGVAFAVDDGREGFPSRLVEEPVDGVEMKVVDGALRIKSSRTASRYVGKSASPLVNSEGFVDTTDLVERRGDRHYFVGRRSEIINVGGLKVNPEEVETVLNGHAGVRMSRVVDRKNPVTGASRRRSGSLRSADGRRRFGPRYSGALPATAGTPQEAGHHPVRRKPESQRSRQA